MEDNFFATTDTSKIAQADIIICDVNLDVVKKNRVDDVNLNHLKKAIISIANNMKKKSLIIIETTVPPGTCENYIVPILNKYLSKRGFDEDSYYLAHSFERVMPGKDYLSSISNFWRVYAGKCRKSAEKCREFFSSLINTKDYPLTELSSMRASELTKVMENSYRAVNIAFIDEWTKFANEININLAESIEAIKVRPTHSNIMSPGFGVGGYCLTKDPLLANIGARNFYSLSDMSFPFSEMSIKINNEMPSSSINMIKNMIGNFKNKSICVLGASYREDIADTRYSPSVKFIKEVLKLGSYITVYDPLVKNLYDLDIKLVNKIPENEDFDLIVITVKHEEFNKINFKKWLGNSKPFVFDANYVLTDKQVKDIKFLGCKFNGIGRSIRESE